MKQKPEQLYNAHINIIRKLAWYHQKNTNIPFDELMSVGTETFVKILNKHEEEKGKFSTILTIATDNALKDFKSQWFNWNRNIDRYSKQQDITEFPVIIQKIEFGQKINQSTEQTREVIKIILEKPITEIGKIKPKPKITQETVRKFLRKIGWSTWKIDQTFIEVRKLVRREQS